MAKKPDHFNPLRAYNGFDVMQDDMPSTGDTMLFVRFKTVELAGPGKMKDGATPWVMTSMEALEGLLAQLTNVVASIKQIEAGSEPENVSPAKGVSVVRLPDGPTN